MRCSARCSSARPAPRAVRKTSMIHGPPNGGGASVMRPDQDRGDHLAVGARQAAPRQQRPELARQDALEVPRRPPRSMPVQVAGGRTRRGRPAGARSPGGRPASARSASRLGPRVAGRARRRANGGAGARRRPPARARVLRPPIRDAAQLALQRPGAHARPATCSVSRSAITRSSRSTCTKRAIGSPFSSISVRRSG